MANQTYKISAGSPLLRPGLTISVETSERYADEAVKKLMSVVRKVNDTTKDNVPAAPAPAPYPDIPHA